MPYCSRCGVEVSAQSRTCPLCQAPIQHFEPDALSVQPFPEDDLPPAQPPSMNRKERLRMASVVTTFGVLIPVLVTLSADLALNARLTWSYYPLIILSGCLLLTLAALFGYRHPPRIIGACFVVISLMLLCLHSIYALPPATVKLGIPITAYAALASYLAWRASTRAEQRGSNIAAYILLAIAGFCLASDITINHHLHGSLLPGWSLVMLAATLPVALMLLYLQHRTEYEARLRKYFHL